MLKSPIFTWIEINLSAVENNVKALRAIAGVPIMAVVKANGYGHGAIEVSRAALAAGASWLAVSCAEEAIVLREAGITVPILVLGMVHEPVDQPEVGRERLVGLTLLPRLFKLGLKRHQRHRRQDQQQAVPVRLHVCLS